MGRPGGAEGVDDAGGQRRLGADHGEGDLLGRTKSISAGMAADRHVLDARLAGGARLPGATKTLWTRATARESFQARACSRPPPPMTRIFMGGARISDGSGGSR